MALTFKFRADGSGYQRGLEKMRTQTQKWTGGIKGMIAGAFALGAVLRGFQSLMDKMDRIHKLSQRYGASAEAIQKLGFAAEQNGASMEIMAKAMAQANRSAQEAANGLKTYSRAFDALNINIEEFKSLDQESQMHAIADAVANATDKNKAMAAAQQLLGRSALELMPLLKQGSQGIRELTGDLKTMSDEQVAAAARARDTVNRVKTDVSATLVNWFAAFATGFKALVAMATQTVIEVGDAVDSVGRAIKAGVKGNFSGAADIMEKAVEKARTAGKRINEAMHDADGGPATGGSGGGGYGGSGSSGAGENDPANERLKIERQISEEIKKQKEATMTMAEKAKSAKEEWAKLQDAAYDAAEKAEKSGSEEDKTAAARAELAREQAYSKYQQAKKQADAQRGRELQAMDEADQRRIKAQADAQAQAEAQAAEDNKRGDEVYAEAQREAEANKAPLATSVISSSLASIGGGGGVAAFTNDPAVIEAQKQTKLLEEIKTALQPAAGINTNGRPEL